MTLPDFTLVRPGSVDEALAALGEDRVPVCGGTELLLAMRLGMLEPQALVDVSRVPALGRLGVEGDELVVGAGVSHKRAAAAPEVREHVPVLADVEERVGNPRVRAQGSIGGNLCFAEPKSDVATVLIALDAAVVLAGPAGTRRVAMRDFVEGPYTTARDDAELLVEVRVPLAPARRGVYVKFQTMERPTVGVAAVAGPERVRVVVGAVGPAPVTADFGALAEADIDAVMADVEPLPDLTGSAAYKTHVTEVYLRRALEGLRWPTR